MSDLIVMAVVVKGTNHDSSDLRVVIYFFIWHCEQQLCCIRCYVPATTPWATTVHRTQQEKRIMQTLKKKRLNS